MATGDKLVKLDGLKAAYDALKNKTDNKADIDGYYEGMTVGDAEQLVATVGVQDKVPYNFRTSGGSIEIGDREVDKIIGGAVAWNQRYNPANISTVTNNGITFTKNSDGTITVTGTATEEAVLQLVGGMEVAVGHKMLIQGCPSGGAYAKYYIGSSPNKDYGSGMIVENTTTTRYVWISVRSGVEITTPLVFKPQIYDITKMFGSTIADYIYSLETATPGAGVAWFRALFPKDYYAYDAGTLRSVQVSAHKMVGFNAYDNETGKALVIGGSEYEITGTYTALSLDGETVTPVSGKFTPAKSGELTVTGGDGTTCIHLRWDGERDGEFEPYTVHTYPLDSSLELRGLPKLDANNRLYYDGDEYESDGTVKRNYTVINDLGSVNWYVVGKNGFYFQAPLHKVGAGYTKLNALDTVGLTYLQLGGSGNESYIVVYDDNSAGMSSAQFAAKMAGQKLVYELATTTTETAAPYQNPQIVDDFGTEQYIDAGDRDVEIPVGHDTYYRQNLRAKLETAPNSPDSNGDYLMRRNNGQNSYVPYASPLPALPAEDGTYTLKCTVSGGTAALSWEAET